MAALTADRKTRMRSQGTHRHRTCKLGAVKVFKGGIACKNSTGYLVPASDSAALIAVGIFEQTVDNSAGAPGDLSAAYVTGVEVELVNAGGAIVQAIKQAYVSDDQSVTSAAVAANDVYVGPVTEFTTTKVWVGLDEESNMAPPTATPVQMFTVRKRFTVAEYNAGASLVAAVPGQKIRMVDSGAIAIGGAAGAVTTADILATQAAGSVKLVAFAQASLTQSTLLRAGGAGAAIIADGASFIANDTNTAITVLKTGADITTATHIDVSFTYVLE